MDISNPQDPSAPANTSGRTTTRDDSVSDDERPIDDGIAPLNVVDLFRPFDPMSDEAEVQYDTVAQRVNRIHARLHHNKRERLELERQFVENDLTVRSGSRAGLPLSARGRRQRIKRLIELSIEAKRLIEEGNFSVRVLGRMNEELDRWARETYCP